MVFGEKTSEQHTYGGGCIIWFKSTVGSVLVVSAERELQNRISTKFHVYWLAFYSNNRYKEINTGLPRFYHMVCLYTDTTGSKVAQEPLVRLANN